MAPVSLQRLPTELRLHIWEHLLVSPNTITPWYSVCQECVEKPENRQQATRHTSHCIYDHQLSLNLYPNILQTCRLCHKEGRDLLYSKNRFANLCSDATAAYFFQSIGEDNARRIQSYTLMWQWVTPLSGGAASLLIYLSWLPNLQSLIIEEFDKAYKTTEPNLQWLSRIRAKDIQWEKLDRGTKEQYSNIITSTVFKQKLKLSWADIVSYLIKTVHCL
jgi:hypothetical protein